MFGPDTKAQATATLAKRPFHLAIHIHPDGARRVMEIKSDDAQEPLQTLPLLPVLDGASAIGLMAPLPETLRRYLPPEVDARGTDVVHDLKADSWTGQLIGHWPGGSLSGNLIADQHVIRVAHLDTADPVRLTAEGALSVDIDNDQLQLDCSRWQPGSSLPFPAAVPLAAILPVVPQASLSFSWRGDVLKVHCLASAPSPSQAQMTVDWTSGKPVTVTGSTLPLTLAQTFVPDHVVIDDGIATHFDLAIGDHGIAGCNVEAAQARLGAFGWTVGDLDGTISISPGAGEALIINAGLTRPTHAEGGSDAVHIGDIFYYEHAGGGSYRFRLSRVEDLLIRMHGPFGLPDLRGALDLDLDLTATPGRLKGVIQSMAIESMAMPDLLQNCAATIKGDFAWQDHSLTTTLRGQLKRGQMRLPGTWLDVASNTPIFTTTVSYSPAVGFAPASIDISELLVQAADAHGDPQPNRYSAELSGNLTASGTGEVTGVVDHLDLGWVNSLLSLGALSMSGEGAIVVSADLQDAQMSRLDGAFLPSNCDLLIGNAFKATGITGEVQFTMAKTGGDGAP